MDLDPRPGLEEPAQQPGQHPGPHALEDPDPEAAHLAGRERGDVGLGREPGDDGIGVGQERLADLGQADGAGPAGSVEQRRADQPLERRHLLADAGLGVAELPGGGAERSGRDDRPERKEVAQLDALPPRGAISSSDGNGF